MAVLLLGSVLAGCGEKKPDAITATEDPYAHLQDANIPKKRAADCRPYIKVHNQ